MTPLIDDATDAIRNRVGGAAAEPFAPGPDVTADASQPVISECGRRGPATTPSSSSGISTRFRCLPWRASQTLDEFLLTGFIQRRSALAIGNVASVGIDKL